VVFLLDVTWIGPGCVECISICEKRLGKMLGQLASKNLGLRIFVGLCEQSNGGDENPRDGPSHNAVSHYSNVGLSFPLSVTLLDSVHRTEVKQTTFQLHDDRILYCKAVLTSIRSFSLLD
jgi:hypothetical protein